MDLDLAVILVVDGLARAILNRTGIYQFALHSSTSKFTPRSRSTTDDYGDSR
jgi:hypothetical protein